MLNLMTTRPSPAPLVLDKTVLIASAELQAARLAVCRACRYLVDGVSCKQCCGSTPVAALVRLVPSRCPHGFWKE